MTPRTKRERRFAHLTYLTMLSECIENERMLSVADECESLGLPEDDGDWNNSDGDEQDNDGDC